MADSEVRSRVALPAREAALNAMLDQANAIAWSPYDFSQGVISATIIALRDELSGALSRADAAEALMEASIAAAAQEVSETRKAVAHERTRREQAEQALSDSGVVTGDDAEAIWQEVMHGTPDTPERRRLFEMADKIYASHRPDCPKCAVERARREAAEAELFEVQGQRDAWAATAGLARRGALEEAAKLICSACANGEPRKNDAVRSRHPWHEQPRHSDPCAAANIWRALASDDPANQETTKDAVVQVRPGPSCLPACDATGHAPGCPFVEWLDRQDDPQAAP